MKLETLKSFNKNKLIIPISIISVIALISVGITYAYLTLVKEQDIANTFKTGCLNVAIESETDSINLDKAVSKTDIKGLEEKGYTFTIHNTCETSANYEINLEELSNPDNPNTLKAEYLKVSLSSDTFDNLITKLSENTEVTKHISNSYKAYNLYNGTIDGGDTKQFTLKEWIDYNVTKEQGQNKTINTKINVVSGSNNGTEITPSNISEVKFENTTGTIIGDTTNIKYCTSEDNECEPSTGITATSNKIEVSLSGTGIICVSINNKETVCSNLIKKLTPVEQIIASSKGTLPSTFTSVCDNTDCSGVYEAPDEDETTSYYFRGVVENNYVKFGKMGKENTGADIWWRIIRINGDGSIRMIFAGTGTGNNAPTQTGSGTIIGDSAFNNSVDRAEYVGFEYKLGLRNGNSGGNKNQKSNALQVLETWFKENLSDEFGDGINTPIDANAGFCADRPAYSQSGEYPNYVYTRNDNLGTGTQKTYYGGYIRTTQTHQPTFKCEDKEHDLFTYTGSNQGTKTLTYPIGLTTIDEQVYAGGYWLRGNKKYYLYNNTNYWTMSPCVFDGSDASVGFVANSGSLSYSYNVDFSYGLRPELNLKSEYLTTGSGVSNDPYRLS